MSIEAVPFFLKNYRKIAHFFWGSLAGVTVDLFFFQVLVYATIQPLHANMVSSALAITTTYFLVTRYTFKQSPNPKKFALFFAYYTVSILFFSFAINYTVNISKLTPLFCKICSLPFSFLTNFLFSNIILGAKGGK